VLLLDLEDRVEVSENVRVVFELVADGLVFRLGKEFVEVLRPEVGHSERGSEFTLVLHIFEDLPEFDEFALGRNEGVVDQDEIRLSSEFLDGFQDVRAKIFELDTSLVWVTVDGRDCGWI